MKKFALLGVLMLASPLLAQFPPPLQQQPPPQPPVISPYLQMLNRNRSPALNYYNGVMPLQQLNNQQNQLNQIQNQLQGMQNVPQAYFPGTGSELITGKYVGYFTHRGYFMNYGGVGVQRSLTGQYGNAGNNPVYNSPPPSLSNNSIMPFRR